MHQAPLPDMVKGKYRDPSTAGELYAKEVKEIIDKIHSQGKKVCVVYKRKCIVLITAAGMVCVVICFHM